MTWRGMTWRGMTRCCWRISQIKSWNSHLFDRAICSSYLIEKLVHGDNSKMQTTAVRHRSGRHPDNYSISGNWPAESHASCMRAIEGELCQGITVYRICGVGIGVNKGVPSLRIHLNLQTGNGHRRCKGQCKSITVLTVGLIKEGSPSNTNRTGIFRNMRRWH